MPILARNSNESIGRPRGASVARVGTSQQITKLIDGQTGLTNDVAQRSEFETASAEKRPGHGASSIAWVNQHTMTAGDAVDNEPCLTQCRQHLPRVHDR
jgi:hypothetical protein